MLLLASTFLHVPSESLRKEAHLTGVSRPKNTGQGLLDVGIDRSNSHFKSIGPCFWPQNLCATSHHTLVLVDTFVQWIHAHASGLMVFTKMPNHPDATLLMDALSYERQAEARRTAGAGQPVRPGGVKIMRSDIVPGGIFPDYKLPDHTDTERKLS